MKFRALVRGDHGYGDHDALYVIYSHQKKSVFLEHCQNEKLLLQDLEIE